MECEYYGPNAEPELQFRRGTPATFVFQQLQFRRTRLQSVGAEPMIGIGEGWHELEWDSDVGRAFRWSGERSVRRERVCTQRQLRITGESRLRYYDAALARTNHHRPHFFCQPNDRRVPIDAGSVCGAARWRRSRRLAHHMDR